jgi:uncharacterized protein YqgV (UPF0045/DUF77 family)
MLQIVSFDVGTKNFAYCVLEVDPDTKVTHVKQLDVVSIGNKRDMQGLIDACIDLLDDIVYRQLNPALPTMVLIEAQMTAVMKCVQTAINTFFKVTAKYGSSDVQTKYLSARHKLTLMNHYTDYTPSRAKDTGAMSKYKQNKVDSVDLATWILRDKEQDHATLQKIMGMKKKDDATDAYLMALYYAKTCV